MSMKYFFIIIPVLGCVSGNVTNQINICCSHGASFSKDGISCTKIQKNVPDIPEANQLLCRSVAEFCCNQERLLLDCKLGVAFAKSYDHCLLDNTTRGCSGQAETCCSACLLAQTLSRHRQECKLPNFTDSTLTQVFNNCCPDNSVTPDDDKEYETYDEPNFQNLCEMFPGQLCAHTCVASANSYYCKCFDGYVLMEDQKTCQPEKVKPKVNQTVLILPNPEKPVPLKKPMNYIPNVPLSKEKCAVINNCEQECVDTLQGQMCSCRPGYELSHDRIHCKDINECLDNVHICDPSLEICMNEIGGYKCIARNITTPWMPSSQKSKYLTTTTALPLIPIVTQRAPEKRCLTGFNRENDNCVDIDECDSHNHPEVCEPQEQCINTIGSFQCRCQIGYHRLSSSSPCIDINECQQNMHNCLPEQRCDNSIGSYYCHRIAGCGTGYTLNINSGSCEDDDECTLGTHNCQHLGKGYNCRNTLGSFKCERQRCTGDMLNCTSSFCPKGFRETNEGQCIDIDECKENHHGCHPTLEVCYNRRGSYECRKLPRCPAGFDSKPEGCKDIDECARGSHSCDEYSTCHNFNGGYSCKCHSGFWKNGTSCVDIDECSHYGCEQSAECQNTIGSYRCNCKTGFAQIAENHCQDENECILQPGLCEHHCTNSYGSYRCTCKNGFRLNENNRSCDDIDECTRFQNGELCVGECVNTPGSFVCRCPPGYLLGGDGRTCQDIDECIKNPCRDPDEVCLNTGGSYACNSIACPPGYSKDSNQKNRCRQTNVCLDSVAQCLQKPSTLSFNFITFVSKLPIPSAGHLDLFAMRGPPVASSDAHFELSLLHANAPAHVAAVSKDYFHLRHPGWGQAVVALVRPIQGPQEIHLELIANLFQNGLPAGKAVAKLFIHVSRYEY